MRPLPRHRSLPDTPLVQEICPQPCPGRCKTSLLPEGPLGNETLQCGEQILRFLSLLPLHTATIKIKTLESEPRFVGFFFSFVCLGTLLLPYQLLSSINNTVTTKFKFLYEMLTNLILFLFLTFILYYLDSLFFFLKNLT